MALRPTNAVWVSTIDTYQAILDVFGDVSGGNEQLGTIESDQRVLEANLNRPTTATTSDSISTDSTFAVSCS